MADKYLTKAQKLAKSSIFDDATYLGEWKEYAVYEPTFNDYEPRFIVFPQFILVQDGSIRWTADYSESTAIMEKFYSGN